MASVAKGKLIVPVWCDDGEIKPIVDDSGLVPVTMSFAGLTFDVNLESSDITLNVNVIQASGNIPVVIADCQVTLPVHLKGSDITLGVQLKGSDITLGVTESSPLTAIQGQAYGWDGSQWRKSGLLWGYNDRYAEDLGGTKSGAGQYSANSTAVPAGEIWVVNFVTLRNHTAARGAALLMVYDGSAYYRFVYDATPAQSVPLTYTGNLALKEGDFINVRMDTCQDGDTIHAGVWGYKMKVNQ